MEQLDRAKLTQKVLEAVDRAQSENTRIFEQRPDLAAAAYYLLDTSPHGQTHQARQTLATLQKTIRQSMSPYSWSSPIPDTLSTEFRIRSLMIESPAALYGLVHLAQNPGGSSDFPLQDGLFGGYRFKNELLLNFFGLFTLYDRSVPGTVRAHALNSENLARFDGLVRNETATPTRPEGVSIAEGIKILLTGSVEEFHPSHSEMLRGIKYMTVNTSGTPSLVVRSPGSGITHFINLNLMQEDAAARLAGAYAHFSSDNSDVKILRTFLKEYLTNALGRRPSPEEILDYLQEGRPGFPVRDTIIEALGVRPEDFDRTIERAANEGAFGEALRSNEARSSRRRELEARRGK
jgi:hypothetical protein